MSISEKTFSSYTHEINRYNAYIGDWKKSYGIISRIAFSALDFVRKIAFNNNLIDGNISSSWKDRLNSDINNFKVGIGKIPSVTSQRDWKETKNKTQKQISTYVTQQEQKVDSSGEKPFLQW